MDDIIRQSALPKNTTSEDRHFLRIAIACAIIGFVGFIPTYLAPLARGTLASTPLIHMHAIVFFAWGLFLIYQTWLGASGQIRSHRRIGLLGVSLVTLMTLFGLATSIHRMHWAASLGQLEAGKAFALLPISAILFFAAVFTAAVACARQRDWHKRLMMLAALSILDAPIARWFIVFLAPEAPAGPPPIAVGMAPAGVAMMLMLVAMALDKRISGRFHPAYVIGIFAYAASKLMLIPVSQSGAWQAAAGWLMKLGG